MNLTIGQHGLEGAGVVGATTDLKGNSEGLASQEMGKGNRKQTTNKISLQAKESSWTQASCVLILYQNKQHLCLQTTEAAAFNSSIRMAENC